MKEHAVQYHPTSHQDKSAVILVAHGLNVKPVAMMALVNWLTEQGADVFLIQLSGHYQEGISIQEVTMANWQQDMHNGYSIAKKAASDQGLPFYFLGYSLGALLGLSMIALKHDRPCFDKQVLLAPAMAIRNRCYLVQPFCFLGNKMFLPSFTPVSYRANDSIPLSVYKILFMEERKVLHSTNDSLNVPTVIFMDPKDELISYQKLKSLIVRNKLTNYEIILLNSDLKGRIGRYHHLILDESAMGKQNWKMVTHKMNDFLFSIAAQ